MRSPRPAQSAPAHPRAKGLALAVACFTGLVVLWWAFVDTLPGQFLEAAALAGSEIGSHRVDGHARVVLSAISMPAAVLLVVVILLVGLLRRSHRRASWAIIAVIGASASAQILKHWILFRPDHGITARWDNANTLPSGHTTMAASAAVALILLVDARWRVPAAWLGAAMTVAMGYSTLVRQWHRPADVVAAVLLAVGWGALAVAGGAWSDGESPSHASPDDIADPARPGFVPSLAHEERDDGESRRQTRRGPYGRGSGSAPRLTALWIVGALCAGISLALGLWVLTRMGSPLGRGEYFASYATGSVALVAASCLSMAGLVALVPDDDARASLPPETP
ncbi:phosphatase PAP2 family protein [Actinomyces gaoshouyii]|uniref:Phosphatidic acid phosphatase n=1 Tax=Actinomyces gaoshouyii TaxID=1960083 RepID=A0A8H9H7I1_9ACTO|nr:phosphatase PAP2 family protein [Actinomyces gaoshouyii]GGO95433.1 phosphatidic acid phosphatase [Actinomyces gaoshouyii]